MASTAAELAGATDNDIASARLALIAYLQGSFPLLAIRGGPLADLVLGPSGNALAAVDVRAAKAKASLNPETALSEGGYDETILNAALAGRGVTRIPAAKATGTVAIRFNTSSNRMIPSGFQFKTAGGVLFAVSSLVSFIAPGSIPVLTTEVALVAEPSGTSWIGTVPVSAVNDGADGNRTAGAAMTPVVDTDTTLVAAWAASNLAGGADAESDAALLARLPAATAPQTAASIAGAEGLVRAAVPAISFVSAVKFGDAELVRGRSVLSTQTPGRFDLWYRNASSPSRDRVRVTATYQGLAGPYGSWRYSLTRTESPARFRVEKVLQAGQAITGAGYVPTAVTVGYDLSNITDPPDIRSNADAAMTRFSTALVTFTDPDTSTVGLTAGVSTKDYDSVCRLIAGIEDAQASVDATDARAAGGDCLVRTAVPGLVSVTAAATAASGVTVTAAQVKEAVAEAVNSMGIASTLSAARVAAEAASRLPQGTSLLLSGWSGTIYPNDGGSAVAATSGTGGLTAADNFARNISEATVAWYCDPESVSATVS